MISPKGNILIVDDTFANLQVLTQMLTEQGYKIRPAVSGKLALKAVHTILPDLILLDIQMPEMNGYQVCEKLKANDKTHDIPVIFISALTEVFDKVKAFTVGGVDYITKPFQAEEVLARVETHLKLHQLQQQLEEQNKIIKAENLRMRAELEVTRRLQQLILPNKQELEQFTGLEIAGFMEPAEQVGGDYYDVLPYNGHIIFGIGDVTGHGLESGMLMLMVQMAVRTLLKSDISNPSTLLTLINNALYENVNRMNCEKTLTLFLADYYKGVLTISGQHEEVIVVRKGDVERIDTVDLGFPLGLEPDVKPFMTEKEVPLNPGDVVILYTDGVTEAENTEGQRYEIGRLCEIARLNWQCSVEEIKQTIVEDVRQYIGKQKVFDDITLLVFKQT